MSGKGNSWAAGILQLLFLGNTMTGIAQNVVSGAITQLYVSLHSADPTASGDQTSSEISYTGYTRVSMPRSSSGWTISGESVSPVSLIVFPPSTGGAGGTASYWAVGTDPSGAGVLLYSGPLAPSIVITNGVTPEITTASTITES